MSERAGRWDLLDRDRDPVIADLVTIDDRLEHFGKLAASLREQSGRLARIGSGESLRGAYADELRDSAETVSGDLAKVVGRYDAVVRALTDFRPAVADALSGSSEALDEAVEAAGAGDAARLLPEAIAPSGEDLTSQQLEDNKAREDALDDAAAGLSAAKTRLADVLARFDEAGREAARTVRSGFNDGLTDSWIDRFVAGFKKFLKILVDVLTYVGIALAVIALVIPGVGPLLLAGAIVGGVAVAAEAALILAGEGSWVDLGIALAGLLTLGVAKVAGPAIKSGFRGAMDSIRNTRRAGRTPSPESERPESPVVDRTPSPEPERPESPVVDRTPSPESERPESPVVDRTPSPEPERPESPVVDRAPSPEPAPAPAPRAWRPRRRERPTEELPPGLDELEPDEILSPEAAAMHRYLGGGATPLNRYLRRGDAPGDAARDTEADLVSRELNKIPPIDRATTFRGVDVDLAGGLKAGDTFVDPGFLSSSLSRDLAESFVRTGGELNGSNTRGVGTVLRFDSEGAGRDVRHLTTTGESEILFDRNTPFDVVDVRSNASRVPDGRGGFIDVHEVDLRTRRAE